MGILAEPTRASTFFGSKQGFENAVPQNQDSVAVPLHQVEAAISF
jgi:hypothetical protein